jgi:hypothetical protein
MKQIFQILWRPFFELIGIYDMHIIVKIMIIDWKDNLNVWLKDMASYSFFHLLTVSEQILPHMNIRSLPIKKHN